MNIFSFYKQCIIDIIRPIAEKYATNREYALPREIALQQSQPSGEFNDNELNDNIYHSIVVESPKNSSYGDLATNVAMILGPKLGIQTKQFAELILDSFRIMPHIIGVEMAGPGFINLRLEHNFWGIFLDSVLLSGLDYGKSNFGIGRRVNVEFASPNPTGPMHIGHARGAIYGDAIARLLKFCGFEVTREFYINDTGKQIVALVESIWIRYQQECGFNEAIIGSDGYPGEYLITLAKKIKLQYSDSLLQLDVEERNKLLKKIALSEMMNLIKKDLKSINVEHDIFISEQDNIIAEHKLGRAITILSAQNLLYKGVLDRPKSCKYVENNKIHKGSVHYSQEPAEQLLFKTTQFGDDMDRSILRSDGSVTYFGADIAYHMDKIDRGFNEMVLLLGADHGGYVKRLKAAVSALSEGKAQIEILINQLVNVIEDKRYVKMSKRAGTFLTLHEVIEELGKDALRFVMLTRKSNTILDLDFEKIREHSKDNLVFYVQYAHTRCVSVLRKACEEGILQSGEMSVDYQEKISEEYPRYSYSPLNKPNYGMLSTAVELEIIRVIANMPRVVEAAALHYEPHRISYYLNDLATCLHHMWTRGMEDKSLHLILEDNCELSRARLGLMYAAASTIGNCLRILGIKPLLKM